jgi:hypothetical protein
LAPIIFFGEGDSTGFQSTGPYGAHPGRVPGFWSKELINDGLTSGRWGSQTRDDMRLWCACGNGARRGLGLARGVVTFDTLGAIPQGLRGDGASGIMRRILALGSEFHCPEHIQAVDDIQWNCYADEFFRVQMHLIYAERFGRGFPGGPSGSECFFLDQFIECTQSALGPLRRRSMGGFPRGGPPKRSTGGIPRGGTSEVPNKFWRVSGQVLN